MYTSHWTICGVYRYDDKVYAFTPIKIDVTMNDISVENARRMLINDIVNDYMIGDNMNSVRECFVR